MKTICAALAALIAASAAAAATPPSDSPGAVFNVRDYGAAGDKKANDQKAIQAAIDACAKAGGGTVRLPAGDYLSGTLHLRSGVTLRLEKGSTLWASTDPADYESKRSGHFLVADDAEHVALTGEGTINGQATADYGARWGAPDPPTFRTGILLFTGCRHVTIRGLTILNSDSWTLHLKRCEDVTIDSVTIRNNLKRLNSDGIDPNSCKRVRISNCDITAGDDCIVLKATEPYPCEDVVVTGCTLETTCTALKLGTESHGDFRDVLFKDCTIRRAPVGIGFYMKDGGTMERIRFSNIKMEASGVEHHTVVPVFMDIERRNADSKIGRIRDVTLEDIDIASGSGILIQGMPESPIENLMLRRIAMRVDRADDYAKRAKPVGGRRTTRDDRDTRFARLPAYATLAYLKNVTVDGLAVRIAPDAMKAFPRSALAGRWIEGGVISGVIREPADAPDAPAAIDLQDCRAVRIDQVRAPE